jgi:hypothetical protein
MTEFPDMSALVSDSLFTCPIAVERRTGAYDNEGIWQDHSQNILTIQASVQPATAEEMSHNAEGERIDGAIRIYTTTELRSSDNQLPGTADIVVYRGERWKVTTVWQWGDYGYFKAIAGRLEK